jgi:hypothetical protein
MTSTIQAKRPGRAQFSGDWWQADGNDLLPHELQSAAASPALTVPPAEVLLVLIRTTLLALNQAVQTGNFTVLRDLGSPDLQAANSPAQRSSLSEVEEV